MNNLRIIYKHHTDIIPSVFGHKADCSPGASQFDNCDSSRILLALNEYLVFGSRSDSTWANDILKDTLGIADSLVQCGRSLLTLSGVWKND